MTAVASKPTGKTTSIWWIECPRNRALLSMVCPLSL
jgi:hypothetical protein